ncbi:MAG: DUF1987 domain-containing protein [Bacteroidetes bacterium]|nr:DUF1987 domain-containing protein [Bacteroidota bacterium]MBV6460115.1 hypothetical protein [Flavobacteriales bacterium]WKZ73986.1 MAG: DUF1987 domain-containing protein [Vicingaceae bacterium]MCL4816465.1 SiaC family regulatory phosphoprotein [Flavobacteriales bacterium]NOG95428.1 DUF1987 domain-containing protein [Bacteroidota bacterium]
MENLYIAPTIRTPEIIFDYAKGELELIGRSIPEHAMQYYTPLFNWIDEYLTKPKANTTLNVKMEYFNTSSSKCVLEIIKKLKKLTENNHQLIVNWYYEEDDIDIKRTGEDFQVLTDFSFQFHGIDDLF